MPHAARENPFELVVRPAGAIRPGETAALAFRLIAPVDAKGGEATVRFELPHGCAIVEGSARFDGTALAPKDAVGISGWKLPALAAGEESVVEVDVRADDVVDDATELPMQAVLACGGDETASNHVVLVARSTARLRGPGSYLKLEPVPGAPNEIAFELHVRNDGASRADAVEIDLPLPEGLALRTESVEADGAHVVAADRRSLRLGAESIAARAEVVATGHVTIERPFPAEVVVVEDVRVRAARIDAFSLPRAIVTAPAHVDFAASDLAPESGAVRVGETIPFRFTARNDGRSPAREVVLTARLPDGLAYQLGSRTLDGSPLAEPEKAEGVAFQLDRIEPGQSVVFAFRALVLGPAPNGTTLQTTFDLEHADGPVLQRTHRATIAAAPRLARDRSWLERISPPSVDAGASVRYAIGVLNDGSTSATGVVLRFEADGFTTLDVVDDWPTKLRTSYDARTRRIAYLLDVGEIAPHERLHLTFEAQVPATIPDRSELVLAASVLADGVEEMPLGTSAVTVRAAGVLRAPASHLRVISPNPLRLQQTAELRLRLENEGTDLLRDVAARLELPPGIALERVHGAHVVDGTLAFADLPPGAPVEASIVVRLVEPQHVERPVEIGAVVTCAGADAFTVSAPVRIVGAPSLRPPRVTLRALAAGELVRAGDLVEAEIVLENAGDAIPEIVVLRAVADPVLLPVAGTTRVDGALVAEPGGIVRIHRDRGLVVDGAIPGEPLRVRWQLRVDPVLAAPAEAAVRVEVRVDDEPVAVVPSQPLAVRPRPAFDETPAYVPEATIEAAPPAPLNHVETWSGDLEPSAPGPAHDEPVANAHLEPHAESNGAYVAEHESVDAAPETDGDLPPIPQAHAAPRPSAAGIDWLTGRPVGEPAAVEEEAPPQDAGAAIAFRWAVLPARVERVLGHLRSLAASDDLGLYRHALVARLFWPDDVRLAGDGGSGGPTLERAREALRGVTTEAFLRMRVPGFRADEAWLAATEDAATRAALDDLLGAIADGAPVDTGSVVDDELEGTIDPARAEALRLRLQDAPLGGPSAAYVVAHFIPTGGGRHAALGDALETFRNGVVSALEPAEDILDLLEPAPASLETALERLVAAIAQLDADLRAGEEVAAR